MKIVHIISGLTTGGAERALYNLLHGGLSSQFDCHVISLNDAGATMGAQIEALGVPLTTLKINSGNPLRSLLNLRKIILMLQPDLVQGWMYHGNLAATLAQTFVNKKFVLVWNVRQSLYHIENEKLMTRQIIKANRFFSKRPDLLLYNCQLSRRQHEAFGYTANKGKVIPNGIDLQQFRFSKVARQKIRTELSIPAEALVIGHVARLHPMKDHTNFLQAVKTVIQHYPDAHFILSGRDVFLDNASLKQQISSSLQNRFHLLGERSDVTDLMSAMDVFCQSSWSEAFPNVLGEAMAIGIPCVATDVGDSALIIGDFGIMVPPKDKTALAAGLESLLALPQNKRRLLGERSRKRIENEFALNTIVEKYTDLYKTKVSEKRKN